MNILILTGGIVSAYATDYAATLASTLRADNHSVRVLVRSSDPDIRAYDSMDALPLGRGGAFDVLSPVRLAGYLRELSGRTIVQVFTARDARLAENAARLSGRKSDIRIVVSLLDADRLAPFKDWERRALEAASVVTVDSPTPHLAINTRLLPPGLPDRRIDGEHNNTDTLRLVYIGAITRDCGLSEVIRALDGCTHSNWHLDVCGTGRGSDVMGIVRRVRADGMSDRVNWRGSDFDSMEVLATCDAVVGADTTYLRLLADCAGRPFVRIADKTDADKLFEAPEALTDAARQARERYEQTGIYDRFYTDLINLYNED